MKKDEKLEKLKKEFDIFNKKANKRELILGAIIFVLTAANRQDILEKMKQLFLKSN